MKKVVGGLLFLGVFLIPSLVSARDFCYREITHKIYIDGILHIQHELVPAPCYYPNAIYYNYPVTPRGYYYDPHTTYYDPVYAPVPHYDPVYAPVPYYDPVICNDNLAGNTLFGAILGGVIGNAASSGGDSSAGTVAGALIGGSLAANLSCY